MPTVSTCGVRLRHVCRAGSTFEVRALPPNWVAGRRVAPHWAASSCRRHRPVDVLSLYLVFHSWLFNYPSHNLISQSLSPRLLHCKKIGHALQHSAGPSRFYSNNRDSDGEVSRKLHIFSPGGRVIGSGRLYEELLVQKPRGVRFQEGRRVPRNRIWQVHGEVQEQYRRRSCWPEVRFPQIRWVLLAFHTTIICNSSFRLPMLSYECRKLWLLVCSVGSRECAGRNNGQCARVSIWVYIWFWPDWWLWELFMLLRVGYVGQRNFEGLILDLR